MKSTEVQTFDAGHALAKRLMKTLDIMQKEELNLCVKKNPAIIIISYNNAIIIIIIRRKSGEKKKHLEKKNCPDYNPGH